MARKEDLDWSFGLINSGGKFLTNETFQSKLAFSATKMKKKQIFFLEKPEAGVVAIRSHLGHYLTCTADGELECQEQGEGQHWQIESQADGRWALKNAKYGWYAGSAGVEIAGTRACFVKEIDESKLFHVVLAMHPMVTIRNKNRKTYLHLVDKPQNSLTCDEVIPWGDDAVVSIHYDGDESQGGVAGTYGIQACNGQWLSNDGSLKDAKGDDTRYIIEYSDDHVAFKSKSTGKYTTCLGSTGLAKATKNSVTSDEQYRLENSYPQLSLKSHNGKFISIKQGVEVAASKAGEVTDLETFQFEPLANGNWNIVANNKDQARFWCETTGGIKAESDTKGAGCEFTVEYHGARMAIKAESGGYLTQQANGYIKTAPAPELDDKFQFEFAIVNRPRIVFRGEHGFINTLPSGILECNKSLGENYTLSTENGRVAIQGENGKFFKVGANGISVQGDVPEYYFIEFYKNSQLSLRTEDGRYFVGHQNGAFTADGGASDKTSRFEY